MTLCLAVLFFVLTPGILLRLPKGGSKMMVAATHAVVFVLVFQLMHKMGWKAYEGFGLNTGVGGGSAPKKLNAGVAGGSAGQGTVPCATGKTRDASGVCV